MLAALVCALGVTCARSESPDARPPLHEIPAELVAPVQSAVVTPARGGPFWEPDSTGHAVAILRADAPNMRYAAMDAATCDAELTKRNVPFVHAAPTEGVMDPVRLRGPLSGGVTIHSMLRPAARETAAMEIFDCRLVLALDDFAAMLAPRGVAEMIHLSAYRPRKQFGCTKKYDGKQHCGALAVDIAEFKKKDGTALVVQRDFHGKVGEPTCPSRPNELWSIVCDAADRAIFNVMLTPNFNAQHFNHVHVEITPDAGWMLVH
jgi:hypothetical protein